MQPRGAPELQQSWAAAMAAEQLPAGWATLLIRSISTHRLGGQSQFSFTLLLISCRATHTLMQSIMHWPCKQYFRPFERHTRHLI